MTSRGLLVAVPFGSMVGSGIVAGVSGSPFLIGAVVVLAALTIGVTVAWVESFGELQHAKGACDALDDLLRKLEGGVA